MKPITRRQFLYGSGAVIGVALLPFRLPDLPAELPKTEYKWLRVTLDVDNGTQITYHSWDSPWTAPDDVRWQQDPDPQWTIETDNQIVGDMDIKVAIGSDDWQKTQRNMQPLMSGRGWKLQGRSSEPNRVYGAWIYDEGTLIQDIDLRSI